MRAAIQPGMSLDMKKLLKTLSNFHFSLTLFPEAWKFTDCKSAISCDITLHNGGIGEIYG